MKSLKGRPNKHCAGETWCWHPWRLPCASVLSVIIRFTVFTPISARQLECGKAAEERR